MAAVQRGSGAIHPVAPVGYEFNDKCAVAVDVEAGDALKFTGNMVGSQPEMTKAAAGDDDVAGFALVKAYAGRKGVDFSTQNELDGFTGLTPGTWLYPSASVAGGLDTTAVAAFGRRVRAVTTTRIRFSLV